MSRQPDISIIIPTRNRWPTIGSRALRAAHCQSGLDVEVIVVDDASDEGTMPMLSTVAGQPVVLIRQVERRGGAAARNAGLAAARAEWVAFLDDDDLWAPYKLHEQLDCADREGADFVYSSVVAVDEKLDIIARYPAPDPGGLAQALRRRNVLPAGQSNVIVRTDLLRAVGGFDEEFSALEDWECWLRLARTGRAAACEDVHVAYVWHDQNMHLIESDIGAEFRRMWRKHPVDAWERPSASILESRWRAFAHRRAGRRRHAVLEYLRSARLDRSFGQLLRAASMALGEGARRRANQLPAPKRHALGWLADYPLLSRHDADR